MRFVPFLLHFVALLLLMYCLLYLFISISRRVSWSINRVTSIRHSTTRRLYSFPLVLPLHIFLIIFSSHGSVILIDDFGLVESLNLFAQDIIIFYSGILLDCIGVWIEVPFLIPPFLHTMFIIRQNSFLLSRKFMFDSDYLLSGLIWSFPVHRNKALHIMKS